MSTPAMQAERTGRTSLFSQIALFSIASVVVAASTVVLVKLYALRYSPAEVSAFLVFRPYGALLVAIGSFGLPIGLRRTVAMLESSPRRSATVSVLGLFMGGVLMALVAGGAGWSGGFITRGIEATSAGQLWHAFLWMTVAQALVTMALSIELGTGRTVWVSAAMVHGFAIAPLAAFVIMPGATFAQVLWMSGNIALLACVPTVVSLMRASIAHGLAEVSTEAKALAKYSAPRMMANVLEWIIEPAVLWLALELAGFSGGGALAVGITLLRLLNPLSVALNQAVVPAAARLSAAQDHEGERRQVLALTEWAWGMGVFATAALLVWCDVLIGHWLGPAFLNAVPTARVLALAAAPSMIYLSLRGVIDGQTERAVNAQSLFLSLVLTLGLGALLLRLFGPALGLGLGYLGGRWLLAGLTLRYQVNSGRLKMSEMRWISPVAVGALLGSLLWLAREYLPGQNDLVQLAVGGTAFAGVYFLVMLRLGASWAATLYRRAHALRPAQPGAGAQQVGL